MATKKEPRDVLSVRIKEELLRQAKSRFELPKLIELYLEEILSKKICPCCGQKVLK